MDILELFWKTFLHDHKRIVDLQMVFGWRTISVTNNYMDLLFAISFSRLSGARVASPFHLLFAKSKKRVRNFTLSRTHCSGCVIHDENPARIVFPRFSATGYNFLYTRRNDYPTFLLSTLFQCTNWLPNTLYAKSGNYTLLCHNDTILIVG